MEAEDCEDPEVEYADLWALRSLLYGGICFKSAFRCE